MDFVRVVAELRRWLEGHNLPTEGVSLIVAMPTLSSTLETEGALKAEAMPFFVAPSAEKLPRGVVARIAGVDVYVHQMVRVS